MCYFVFLIARRFGKLYTMKHPLLLLLFLPTLAMATSGDDRFLAAREAYRVGESARLARMAEDLQAENPANDLLPWTEYWQVSLAISNRQYDGVAPFLAKYVGSYLADKLRADWLKSLGVRAAWPEFMTQYPLLEETTPELTCYFWQARLAVNSERGVLEDVRDMWLSTADIPDACTPLVDQLVRDKRLLASDIWLRIRSLLEQSRYAQAQAIADAYLPERQLPDSKTLEHIAAKPLKYLDHLPADLVRNRQARETVILALLRYVRKDTVDAVTRWRKMEARFNSDDRGYVWGQLARQAARSHMSEALEWYDAAGDAPLSEDQQAWRARAALRTSNWPALLTAIGHMSPGLAAKPDWIYWRARALAATGRKELALTLYRNICAQPGFYGVLAAEELNLPLNLPPRAAAPTQDELSKAAANPGLRQALALFRLDMRTEAVREWNWTVRGMNDRELLAAADLANRNNVFDRTISTAERTLAEHDYSLRYLAPYRDAISPKAQALALDDSWVYGLMRQESRFVTSAKSGVGARGLMQVMPATAKIVARKIGLTGYHPGHVDDLDTNITLGTNYLKIMLQSLDNHPVLACTAYNAGPGRAKRWRGDQPLEGAIYAETIPFAETRDYVKKVMTNSVYYSALFEEKPQTLKSRLGIIQPASPVDKAAAMGNAGDGDEAVP